MKRKMISVLGSMMLIMQFFSPVLAEARFSEGTFHYLTDGNGITITDYFGRNARVEVPSAIAGIPVCGIAKGAFVNTAADTVILPETIMDIDEGAFDDRVTIVFESDQQKNKGESGEMNREKGSLNGDETLKSEMKPALPEIQNGAEMQSEYRVTEVDAPEIVGTGMSNHSLLSVLALGFAGAVLLIMVMSVRKMIKKRSE